MALTGNENFSSKKQNQSIRTQSFANRSTGNVHSTFNCGSYHGSGPAEFAPADLLIRASKLKVPATKRAAMKTSSRASSPEKSTKRNSGSTHHGLDTLTLFVRDTEHEFIAVVTALQAHIDLLDMERERDKLPGARLAVLKRITARLLRDTASLVAVTDAAQAPQGRRQIRIQKIMQEITADTVLAFRRSKVALSSDITADSVLVGQAIPVKDMIKTVVLTLLDKCNARETVQVVGHMSKNQLSLSFDTGTGANNDKFKPWKLGALRLMPTNGEGIGLSAVDAMARLHHGNLNIATMADQRFSYKLIFRSQNKGA